LPIEISEKAEVWISKQIVPSIEAEHKIETIIPEEQPVSILKPNFNIEVESLSTSTPDYKN
jgi:hypothetical protein